MRARKMTDVGRLAHLLDRAAETMVHVDLDRVSPLAVPVLTLIGRERVATGTADDAAAGRGRSAGARGDAAGSAPRVGDCDCIIRLVRARNGRTIACMRRWGFCVAVAASAMAMPLLAWGGQPQKDAGLPASARQACAGARRNARLRRADQPDDGAGLGRRQGAVCVHHRYRRRAIGGVARACRYARARCRVASAIVRFHRARARSIRSRCRRCRRARSAPPRSKRRRSPRPISARRGCSGIDALQGHRVVIDFDRKRMTLAPAKKHPEGRNPGRRRSAAWSADRDPGVVRRASRSRSSSIPDRGSASATWRCWRWPSASRA